MDLYLDSAENDKIVDNAVDSTLNLPLPFGFRIVAFTPEKTYEQYVTFFWKI